MTSVPFAVASGHPRATEAALAVLAKGGSALDAAIAADAVMGVVEPIATGVGGDVMAVVADEHGVATYNGSGRAPAAANAGAVAGSDHGYVVSAGGHAVTVPGTVAGWWDLHRRFGRLKWDAVLQPAVAAAEDGFEVGRVTASVWAAMRHRLDDAGLALYFPDGAPPAAGSTWTNHELAEVLRGVIDVGPDHIYTGDVAKAMCTAVTGAGGTLTLDDLAAHQGEWVDPLVAPAAGHELVTLPPSCQGLVVILAASQLDESGLLGAPMTAAVGLAQVEALDRAFAVALDIVCDPEVQPIPSLDRLRTEVAARQTRGPLPYAPGTVFTAVARGGEFVALISSVCDRFGAGVTAGGHGFVLQSRARGFTVDPAHPNCLAGGKRPYHTIVPTIALREGRPVLSLGVVGGIMQPQGQIQVLGDLLTGSMSVQDAVAAPRFRLLGNGRIALEPGLPPDVPAALEAAGYRTRGPGQVDFGGAHAVCCDEAGVLSAGTDPRKDGVAATRE